MSNAIRNPLISLVVARATPLIGGSSGSHMLCWPSFIPHDLDHELESSSPEQWETVLRSWAKRHGLRLELQWFLELRNAMSELNGRRFSAQNSDRWAVILEWLERYDVPVPADLPVRPEQPPAR